MRQLNRTAGRFNRTLGKEIIIMKIIIMAGGKGTRIASVNSEVPKPMIPILGSPVLEYAIKCMKSQGYTEFIIVIGYLGHIITDYFGTGAKWGVSIQYIVEEMPLGTVGALYYLKEELKEDFLLLNGDIVFDIDIERLFRFHKIKGGAATIFTHPNSHPFDSSIVVADENGCVHQWLVKEGERTWYRNRVNAGIHMLSPRIFSLEPEMFYEVKRMDLDRDVLRPLIDRKELYAYESPEYVKDMGTPDRLESVTEDILTGKVKNKNLKRKQKAIFLDRDGTINRYVGFLHNIEEFELLPYVDEAIKAMNRLGYLVIVISNQPVIARGEVTEEQLQMIHNKMETLLGQGGAYVDAVYYCPHHPDRGFAGERAELKINCCCRKPKPGMLLQAERDYNIDLSQSWMVGDSENDIKAGNAAGCRTVLINGSKKEYGQLMTVDSLRSFAEKLAAIR